MDTVPFRSRGIEWIYVMMSKGIRGEGSSPTLRVHLQGYKIITGNDLLERIINCMSENVQKAANENRENLRIHFQNEQLSLDDIIENTRLVTACSITLVLFEEKYLIPPPPDVDDPSPGSDGESLYSDGTAVSL